MDLNEKDVFLDYISAYNAKDVNRMLALFAENCVFENISAGKVTVRTNGKAELEALARKSAEAFATREQKVISLTLEQGRIAAEIEFRGELETDLTPELKAGTRMELRGVSVSEFSQGRIVRLSDYS